MSGFQVRGIRPCIPKCLFAFLVLTGMIYVDKRRTKKILEFQIGIKPATPSMTYPWAIGNFSTGLAKKQCYIAPFLMSLVFILQKHTYISVKEGINEPLSCGSCHCTWRVPFASEYQKNIPNGTFIPALFSCRFLVRFKRLFILTCKQARMGTRQAASDGEI